MADRDMTAARVVGWNLLVLAAYAAIGALTLLVARYTGLAAPVWPAAGMAFALVYLRGPILLPGVALGSFALNGGVLLLDGTSVTTAAGVAVAIGLGAALQAACGSELVHRLVGGHLSLSSGGEVLAFLLLAGPVSCLVNPTVGVAAQLVAGILPPHAAVLGWLTWWVGDSAGVIVFAPMVLMLFREQNDIWRDRRWKVALPSLLAVLILGGAFLQNSAQERHQISTERTAFADSAVRDIQGTLARNEEALRGVKAMVEADEYVTRDEFGVFTRDALRRFPNLHALSWNPVVSRSRLAAFVEHQVNAEGITGFRVTERGAGGTLRPVSAHMDYVVVAYIEPLRDNSRALGYDIKSDPVRAAAIARATDTGEASATAPIDLVQESGPQKGALLLLPVYADATLPPNETLRQASIIGFAAGVYRLGDLLVSAFDNAQWRDITFDMYDITDASQPVLLGRQAGRSESSADNTSSVTFPMGGRTWRLDVTPPPDAFGNSATAPAFLLAGLLILTLLEAFVLLVTGMERQARRRADASHYDAVHDSLTDLLNRRAFMERMSEVQARSANDGTTHVLMYLDLDDFKAVNDRGGHETGDRCLREIATRFAHCVRAGDTVARVGGDEFAVILDACPLERGLDVARQFVSAAESYRPFPDDPGLVVGVSVGVTTIEPHTRASTDELLHNADLACYLAKREGKHEGRSHVQVFDASRAADAE